MSDFDETAPLLEWLRQPRWMEGAKQKRLFEAAAEIERLRSLCESLADDNERLIRVGTPGERR